MILSVFLYEGDCLYEDRSYSEVSSPSSSLQGREQINEFDSLIIKILSESNES